MFKRIFVIFVTIFTSEVSHCQTWQESSYYFNASTIQSGKNYELSNIYIDSAINLNPNKAEYYELKGMNYFRMKDYKNSILVFSKAILLKPKSEWSLLYRSYSKSILNDNRGALLDINKAIPLLLQTQISKEELSSIFTNKARIEYFLGKYTEAIIDCNTAIKYDNSNSETYFIKGMTYIELGDKENGCLALSKAGEYGWEKAYQAISENCQ
jgi:tetratricopeptide (TPR) repeat protein